MRSPSQDGGGGGDGAAAGRTVASHIEAPGPAFSGPGGPSEQGPEAGGGPGLEVRAGHAQATVLWGGRGPQVVGCAVVQSC